MTLGSPWWRCTAGSTKFGHTNTRSAISGVYAAIDAETVNHVVTPHAAISATNTDRTGSKASALRNPAFGMPGWVWVFVSTRGPV